MPADRSGTGCGTAVCYIGETDLLTGPGGALISMSGPTGDPGDCNAYARTAAGGGTTLIGQEPITISGTSTVEYTYTSTSDSRTYYQYIAFVSNDLVGCLSIHVMAGAPPVDHRVVDEILRTISFQQGA